MTLKDSRYSFSVSSKEKEKRKYLPLAKFTFKFRQYLIGVLSFFQNLIFLFHLSVRHLRSGQARGRLFEESRNLIASCGLQSVGPQPEQNAEKFEEKQIVYSLRLL